GRTDLYSLGVILYEAFTGRTPFRKEGATDTPISIIVRHVSVPPPPPRSLSPAISPPVETVLLRALAKDPDDRYPTGAALFYALGEALSAASPAPIPVGAPRRSEPAPEAVPAPTQAPPPAAADPASTPALTPVAVAAAPALAAPPPASAAPWSRVTNAQRIGCGALLLLLLLAGVGGAIAMASRGGG